LDRQTNLTEVGPERSLCKSAPSAVSALEVFGERERVLHQKLDHQINLTEIGAEKVPAQAADHHSLQSAGKRKRQPVGLPSEG
jgi:hypothetical protein